MKKHFLVIALVFCSQFVFSQVNPAPQKVPVSSLKLTPIASSKATIIRKDTRTLQSQIARLNDSVSVLKKEMDLLMTSTKDSLGEMSELEQLRLQQAMERMSQLYQMISNIMKSMHDTQTSIINNIKG